MPKIGRCLWAINAVLILLVLIAVWDQVAEIHIRSIRWYADTGRRQCVKHNTAINDHLTQSRRLLLGTVVALEAHGIRTTVCHGTLWGVLRNGDLLPGDEAPDLCVLDSELTGVSLDNGEYDVLERLSRSGFNISDYDRWLGRYRLSHSNFSMPDSKIPELNLRVFSECDYLPSWSVQRQRTLSEYWAGITKIQLVCPSSWAFYVFYLRDDSYQAIPRYLLEPPYSKMKLLDAEVPVPHDDLEMQKYVYPNDWHIEIQPRIC